MLKRNFPTLSASGEFYRRRDEWIRHVEKKTEWDASVRLIGCYLAHRFNPNELYTWPMQSTIARELGFSVPTVKRAIATLVGAEFLNVRKIKRPNARRAVNHYRLVYPWD